MTAKRSNGANGAHETETQFSSLMALAPAANSFRISQRMALEAARFWARRMHAYAEQLETLAACGDPKQLVAVQARFLARMQDDYVAESDALKQIWTQPDSEADESERA